MASTRVSYVRTRARRDATFTSGAVPWADTTSTSPPASIQSAASSFVGRSAHNIRASIDNSDLRPRTLKTSPGNETGGGLRSSSVLSSQAAVLAGARGPGITAVSSKTYSPYKNRSDRGVRTRRSINTDGESPKPRAVQFSNHGDIELLVTRDSVGSNSFTAVQDRQQISVSFSDQQEDDQRGRVTETTSRIQVIKSASKKDNLYSALNEKVLIDLVSIGDCTDHADHDSRERKIKAIETNVSGIFQLRGMGLGKFEADTLKHSILDEAGMDDEESEKQLQAVFVSFAEFGKWHPQGIADLGTNRKVFNSISMGGNNFTGLCIQSGLVDEYFVTREIVHGIFVHARDKRTKLLNFCQFIVALSKVCEVNSWTARLVMQSVLQLNEGSGQTLVRRPTFAPEQLQELRHEEDA